MSNRRPSWEEVTHDIAEIDDVTEEMARAMVDLSDIYDIKTEEVEKMKSTRFTNIFKRLKIFKKNNQPN
jgi:hypothetical protein